MRVKQHNQIQIDDLNVINTLTTRLLQNILFRNRLGIPALLPTGKFHFQTKLRTENSEQNTLCVNKALQLNNVLYVEIK